MISKAKEVRRRPGDRREAPVAAGFSIPQGAMVVLQAGFADNGKEAAGLVAIGVAEAGCHNPGANGAASVPVRSEGAWLMKNHATDPITKADIGSDFFIADNETVARTNGGGSRSRGGSIFDVEDLGVWVKFD